MEKGIGFLPMGLEEQIMIISKRHRIGFKDALGILNALVDSKITMEELNVTAKSTSAYQNKLEKKTKEIWAKVEPKYKGDLRGNMYYSTLRDIIIFEILKEYKPFRKYQK